MNHEETKLHISVVHYLRAVHPDLLFFHPLQGGFAVDARQGAKFKAMGLRPGIPDLCLLLPSQAPRWIELKTKKGVLSDEQAEVINRLRRLGCEVEVCRSLDAVIATLERWNIKGRAVATTG